MSQSQIEKIVDFALEEDAARGDITSELLIPTNLAGRAVIIAREDAIFAGGEIAKIVFLKVDSKMEVDVQVQDGKRVKRGDIVMLVTGRVQSILKAERTALNFISRLSGVATETGKYIAKLEGLNVAISDTRKTTPGIRLLEKYAVYAAGGQTHRPDLGSGILIKDNHLVALAAKGVNLAQAIAKAKENKRGMKVEIEVNTIEQAKEAGAAGADTIMLDNMSPEEMRAAVDVIPENVTIEASGGITLANVRQVAETGVDIISVGAITHSAPAVDFSLEFPVEPPAA